MEEQLVVLVDPWRDKYDRLLEAHEKLQRLNQNLEEKLLKLAEDSNLEATRLSHQVQELTQRLVEARLYIHQLEDENDRYRSDISVVVQLLHCKPSNFVSPKLDTLPEDLQRKVLGQRNGSSCKKEKKIIKVQVPTFPPTDIMYAVDKGKGKNKNGEKDIVSAAIMARVLQERENERKENRKNRCKCASHIVLPTLDSDTQTLPVCTISYTDFNFSEFEEDNNEEVDDEEEVDTIKANPPSSSTRKASPPEIPATTATPTATNVSVTGSGRSTSFDEPYEKPCSPSVASATVDEIMKPDQKEEELLPTPLFRRKDNKAHYKRQDTDHDALDLYKEQQRTLVLEQYKEQEERNHSSAMDQYYTNADPHHHHHRYHLDHFHLQDQQDSSSFPSPTSLSSSNSPVSSSGDMAHSSSGTDPTNEPMASYILGQSNTTNTSNLINSNRKVAHRPTSMNLHKERSWERQAAAESSSSYRNGLVSHWRTTVLVHHPPKSHSYEPLALTNASSSNSSSMGTGAGVTTTTTKNTRGGSHQQTTFGVAGSSSELLMDSPSDEQPLLHNYANLNNANNVSQPPTTAQYYRAQKRTFWTRSSSTTSTETEI